MSTSSAAALPTNDIYEDLLPPYHAVSPGNKGAYALLTAVILIIIVGLAVSVKLQMTVATFRKLRYDDYTIIASMVLGIGYTVAICQSVHFGLGRRADLLTSAQVERLSESYYAANLLLYMSLAFAKVSVALLVIAIQPKRWIALTLWTVVGVVAAWAVAAIFTIALECSPDRFALGPTNETICIDQYTAHIGIKIVDIVTDIVLAVLPAAMMQYVQVAISKRMVVSFMFGLRLLTPVFTAISLATLSGFYNADASDRPFKAVVPSIWTSVALNVSILTACLPSIKRFLADWAAGVANAGLAEPLELQNSSQSRTRRGNPMTSSARHATGLGTGNLSKIEREDGTDFADYTRGGRDVRAKGSDDVETESKEGLTDGIILQTFDYTVEYEEDRHRRDAGRIDTERRRHLVQ